MARKRYMTDAEARENAVRLADLERIKGTVRANKLAGRSPFDGLSSFEIAKYSGALMFGDNDEAFPDAATWSAITD